jgi:hypothetical protein
MPTNDEINAFFTATEPALHDMAKQFVPFMFQGAAQQALDSQDGRAAYVKIIRVGMLAAEAVRAKVAPPKAP